MKKRIIFILFSLMLILTSCSKNEKSNENLVNMNVDEIVKKYNLDQNKEFSKQIVDFNFDNIDDLVIYSNNNIYFIDGKSKKILENNFILNINDNNYHFVDNPVQIDENLIMIDIASSNQDVIFSKYKILSSYLDDKIVAFEYINLKTDKQDDNFNTQFIGNIKKINGKNEFYYLNIELTADQENYILNQKFNKSLYLKFNEETKKYDVDENIYFLTESENEVYNPEEEIIIGKPFANMFIENMMLFVDKYPNFFGVNLKGKIETKVRMQYFSAPEYSSNNAFVINIELLDYDKFKNYKIQSKGLSQYMNNQRGHYSVEITIPQYIFLNQDINLLNIKDLMNEKDYQKFKDGSIFEADAVIDNLFVGGWYYSEARENMDILELKNLKEIENEGVSKSDE